MLGPHPYQLIAMPRMQIWQLKETTKQRNKLVQQWLSLHLCGGHRVHKSIRTASMSTKLACQTERFSTADLTLTA